METTTVKPGPPPRIGEQTEVGLRLKDILRERRMSLAALSRASGISTSALSLLTRGGIAYPRTRTVSRICGALKLPTTALLEPVVVSREENLALADGGKPTVQGVALVPLVRIDLADEPLDIGSPQVVPSSLLDGHARLLAVVVTGGGLGPYVLPGDTVYFDPDLEPRHGAPVVLASRGTVFAAAHLATPDGALYRLADGSTLDQDRVTLGGVIVRIVRDAPPPTALLALTRP